MAIATKPAAIAKKRTKQDEGIEPFPFSLSPSASPLALLLTTHKLQLAGGEEREVLPLRGLLGAKLADCGM